MKRLLLLTLSLLSLYNCNAQAPATKLLHKTLGTNQYVNIHAMTEDTQGRLWFATTGEGLYCYDGRVFRQFTERDGLSSNIVYSVMADKAGNTWIGTENGICRYDSRHISYVPILTSNNPYLPGSVAANSVPGTRNEVWCIMQDRKGLIWFGTRQGLYCYDGKVFTRLLDKAGLINHNNLQLTMVNCLLEDRKGTIWIGSGMPPGSEGICRLEGNTLSSFRPGGDGWIRYLLEDAQGTIWMGCRTQGIWRYDGAAFTSYSKDTKLGVAACTSHSGTLWFSGNERADGFSSDGGLWQYKEKQLQKVSNDPIGGYGVWSMLQDRQGNIWVGTRNTGLWRYDGKTFVRFSE